MKIYTKKSIVLEAMGKDKKDTKYLDRAIDRGEVLVVQDEKDSEYYAIKSEFMDSLIINYESRVRELQKEADNTAQLKQELYEAEANVEYYKEEVKAEVKKNEDIISKLKANGLIRSASDLLS